MNSRRLFRIIVQLVIVSVVGWGIYRSIDQSARQLQAQHTELSQRADALELQAQSAQDAEQARQSLDQAAQIRQQMTSFWKADWRYLVMAGLVYAVSMIPTASYWLICLRELGQPVPWRTGVWAYFYGNLGKYVPGKAMVVILRLASLAPLNVRKVATTLTIFMETLTTMAVGGAVGACCVVLLKLDWRINLLAVGLLFCTVVPTAPALLRLVLRRLQPGVDPVTLKQWTDRLHWGLTLKGWFMISFTWAGYGLSLGCLMYGLPSVQWLAQSSWHYWLSIYAACTLSVVVGFVSMMPGGAGVRELVLTIALSPVVGPTAALSSAIWLRIVWLLGEVIMASLSYLIKQRSPALVEQAKA